MKAPDILFVTKPLSPPWVDSGRLLPYLIARHVGDLQIAAMVPATQSIDIPGVLSLGIYGSSDAFSVPGGDKLRLLLHLMRGSLPPVTHFFFSPNRPTSMAARLIARRHPDVKMVQTVMSLPMSEKVLADGLFADTIIVWSEYARRMVSGLVEAKGTGAQVVHVRPGIEPLEPVSPSQKMFLRSGFGLPPEGRVILYAGDLEFSSAATVTAEAIRILNDSMRAVFVFACRPKTPRAKNVLAKIQAALSSEIAAGRVRFMGQVPNFTELLSCVDWQVLPAETTYAKTDIPLVLLEGMSAGVPAVVGTGTPMDELVAAGVAFGVEPGNPQALAELLRKMSAAPDETAAMSTRARQFVIEKHSAEAMARAHAAIYRKLLD